MVRENMGNISAMMKMREIKQKVTRREPPRKSHWFLVPVDVGENVRINMKFSSQDIHEVRDAFAMYDKYSNGTIPTKSFISVMRALGNNLTEEQTNDMICEVDYNRTGVIHFMEFVEVWAKFATDFDTTIKEAFNLFDKDGSGSISIDEFRAVMVTEGAELTDKEIEDILREADSDGDGQIDIDEFVALLLKC